MENKKTELTIHEHMTEETYFNVKWLIERWRPTNYLAIILVSIILVSIISSAITAWVITH